MILNQYFFALFIKIMYKFRYIFLSIFNNKSEVQNDVPYFTIDTNYLSFF